MSALRKACNRVECFDPSRAPLHSLGGIASVLAQAEQVNDMTVIIYEWRADCSRRAWQGAIYNETQRRDFPSLSYFYKWFTTMRKARWIGGKLDSE